jgi:hypothetical protein
MFDAKCVTCGDTNWLLRKSETRSYYANVKDSGMIWSEISAAKKVSPYTVICSKCMVSADDVADMDYMIKKKPLQLIWQTRAWEKWTK